MAEYTFEGASPTQLTTPGQVAAAAWRDKYLAAGNSSNPSDPNAPTIAQIYANAQKALDSGAQLTSANYGEYVNNVPAGGESVGGGVFGGFTSDKSAGGVVTKGGQVAESPASIGNTGYINPNVAAFIAKRPQDYGGGGYPGGTQGLLTNLIPGSVNRVPTASQLASRPPSSTPGTTGGSTGTTGGSTGSTGGTPPPSSTPGTTGGQTGSSGTPGTTGQYRPPASTPGVVPPGAPGTPGANQNAGYSTDGSQLLLDGTPWLDPAAQAIAAKAAAEKADAITRVVDPNELSGTRMNELLSQDSLLMQRARQMGLLEAGRRGLLFSSIAGGAAMGAMADRAQPLALQEAAAFGTAASENMAAQNVAENLNAQLGTDVSKVNAGMETDVGLANTAAINRRNELMFDFNQKNFLERQAFDQEMERIAQLHVNDKEKLALTQQYTKETNAIAEQNANLRAASSAAANEFNSYSQIVAAILADPKKDANTAAKELATAREVHYANMRTIETLHGVDLGDYQVSQSATSGSYAAPGSQVAANFNEAAYYDAHPEVADKSKWEGSAYDHWVQYGSKQGFAFPYINP